MEPNECPQERCERVKYNRAVEDHHKRNEKGDLQADEYARRHGLEKMGPKPIPAIWWTMTAVSLVAWLYLVLKGISIQEAMASNLFFKAFLHLVPTLQAWGFVLPLLLAIAAYIAKLNEPAWNEETRRRERTWWCYTHHRTFTLD